MTLYIDTRPTLEWGGGMHESPYYSETEYGLYSIFQHEQKLLTFNPHSSSRFGRKVVRMGLFKDVEAAKAAAQADYEARTADRFRAIEIPKGKDLPESNSERHIGLVVGWNRYRIHLIDLINKAIAKATTPESLHANP